MFGKDRKEIKAKKVEETKERMIKVREEDNRLLRAKSEQKLFWAIAEKEKCIKTIETLKDQINRVQLKATQLNGCIFVLKDLLNKKEK